MILTILYAAYMGLFLLTTPITFIPYYVLRLFGRKKTARRYIGGAARLYARHVIWSAGGRISVTGLENIPAEKRLCIISNHQGFMDIPAMMAILTVSPGFIAKKELLKIPILSMWMKALDCVMLDRSDIRGAMEVILKGAEHIENGQPMLIFPEGTRSRSDAMGDFRSGSIKLATKARAIIIPVTIQGAYRLFEETKRILPSKINITVHKPMLTADLSKEEQKALPQAIESVIKTGLSIKTHS